MIKNYLLIAFRSFWKNKVFTVINVMGLTVAIACIILFFLFIETESSFDKFHKNGDRLYRVTVEELNSKGNLRKTSITPPALKYVLEERIPAVDKVVRFVDKSLNVKSGDDTFLENIHFTEPDFFTLFSFKFLHGNKEQALQNPNCILLTKEKAIKFFGRTNVVGENLDVQFGSNIERLEITGVLDDPPFNSSLRFNFIANIQKYFLLRNPGADFSWGDFSLNTFILLREGKVNLSEIESNMNRFAINSVEGELLNYFTDTQLRFGLQKFTDIHFQSDFSNHNGLVRSKDPVSGYILSGIGFFLLILAGINFVNLSTGQYIRRLNEVGIRQMVGAVRWQIAGQFWFEAFLLCTISFVLGIMLAELTLPVFNDITNLEINMVPSFKISFLLFSFLLIFAIALFAGAYPAIVLSRNTPVQIMRKTIRLGGAGGFSKTMVILQFVISAFFLVSTLFMKNQIDYLFSKDLGYEDKNLISILVFDPEGDAYYEKYKAKVESHPGIVSISANTGSGFGTPVTINGEEMLTRHDKVMPQFLKTMNITLKEGRTFPEEITDKAGSGVIVNETFVKRADLENPIGTQLDFEYGNVKDPYIIGVMKDYHFMPLKYEIEPLILHRDNHLQAGEIFIRLQPGSESAAIEFLEQTYRDLTPFSPFIYFNREEINEHQFREITNWQKVINYAAFFLVLIALSGLYGLVSLSVVQRRKEIAIRKILGSSESGITISIVNKFLILITAAFLISIPLTYYAVNLWLENFAYKTDLNYGTFIIAGAVMITLAVLTIIIQTIRAAGKNPIEVIKNE